MTADETAYAGAVFNERIGWLGGIKNDDGFCLTMAPSTSGSKNKWDPYPYKPYVFVVENIIDGWLKQGSIDTSDYGPMYELMPVTSLKSCI